MQHLKKKMKFLAVKLSALKSELKVSKEILESAGYEVEKMFKERYFPEQPANPPEQNLDETEIKQKEENQKEKECHEPKFEKEKKEKPEIQIEKKRTPPEIKNLFRKISLKIHPDKLIGLEEGYEKDRKLELYSQARAAVDEEDLLVLANIALELDIDIPEVTEQQLKNAEKQINTIKKELNKIESTIVWQWFFTQDKKQKDNILQGLFKIMYEKQRKNNTRT